jgi:hypothetical protein
MLWGRELREKYYLGDSLRENHESLFLVGTELPCQFLVGTRGNGAQSSESSEKMLWGLAVGTRAKVKLRAQRRELGVSPTQELREKRFREICCGDWS